MVLLVSIKAKERWATTYMRKAMETFKAEQIVKLPAWPLHCPRPPPPALPPAKVARWDLARGWKNNWTKYIETVPERSRQPALQGDL